MSEIVMSAYENWPVQQQQHPVQERTFSPDELFYLLQSKPSIGNPTSLEMSKERRQRRMLSNRESARRSRLRKKRHVQDLQHELNRLKAQNRELKGQLCILTRDSLLVQRDSNRLLSETICLQHKLARLNQLLSPAMRLQWL